jgi:very-short-patch-repair endonuclease
MTDESSQLIDLRVECDRRINFAMQQNDVPVVKALRIENRTETPLRDLEVRISAEPAFAQGWGSRVAAVGERATYNLESVDLELSPGFLGDLTERVRGQLRAEVRREGEVLAHCTVPVELLARDEWGGLTSLPEILAAFVLPNHPAVERVLRSAAEFMSHWTGDPSLNGYQSQDTRRAYTMAAAVYAALQKLGLTYVSPPASFEDEGQRVRLPDRILESRMATCLDMALLAAGCLEQAGLNTLVVLVRGHAFTGVWLRDESFPEPAVDDGLRLRKRVDLSELAVFDPTGVTARPALAYERAVGEAKRHLAAGETFLCAIDVRRARKGRIRPLPERVARREVVGEPEPTAEAAGGEPAAPDVSSLAVGAEPEAGEAEPATETPATRLDRWRRKLLDLSLRNRLLNFRDTKKTLPLLCPDLGQLEDMLAGGGTFQILPRPADLGERDPRDPIAHLRRTGQEGIEELLRDELKARRLYVNTLPEELDRRMIEIYRTARLGLEEGGASALYLAIGFLAWYEAEESNQRRLAPILLLPLELHRKSVREGFTLRLTDDDPRINVTLLELLKQDHGLVIPGLDPLPEDESGLDVPQILRSVRQAVRDIDRWDVVDEARIGLFSFTKFLMWRDLSERVDDLMKNPVVEHLVNRPDQPFDPSGEFPRAELLDEQRAPTDTFCPLPADSSQLAAVFAAAEGRSFVLEGPPGTGKSQTITNLIAHCLTEGKTILFVSEKMAALNVVHRRLVSVGLGRYCLELHSNKVNKREVIGQLEEALQRLQAHGEAEWEREARRLAELRNELNAYVQALHKRRSTGETVFQATSRLIGLRDAPRVHLRWPAPDALNADALAALRDLVARLATAGATCGEVKGHAWEAVRKADWTPGWEEEVHRAIAGLRDAAEALAERARACSDKLGLGESGWSLSELNLIRELTLTLMVSLAPPTALLVRSDGEEIENQVGAWIERGRARDRLRAELRESFRDEILQLDLDNLRARVERAEASWWPTLWWRRRPIRKALKGVAVDGKAPPKQELGAVLDRARALREEQRKLDAASDEARALLGRYWNDGEAEWDGIAQLRDWARGLRALALRATGDDFERGAALRENWARLASEGRDLLRREGSVGREFVAYGEALDAFKKALSQVAELLDLDVERVWGTDSAPDALGRVRSSVGGWQAARQLRDWCAWRRAQAEAMRSNLAPLVEAYEQGAIQSEQLRPVFERSYTQWWLGAVTDREPVLSQFFSPEHDRKIEQFRAVDERYMQLTRLLVQARLAQRVPATSTSVLPNSEMGILKREVGKRRRHMSVRQLLQKIPNLLPRLKPCLLMSPMSVAQYLDADYPPFDVVVFDEASQIPVWDAVGAIARGRQAVIVGDPKQLPPTSFFQRAEDDEEVQGDDVVEDLESILDDCIGAQIPWLPLDWHYRSRHESLITFSNYHYYGNRLLTFPSPALEGLGVSWRHVPHGVYDKGKARTNRAEGEAVVEEILRRLRNPELAKYSIGVVTFSQAQQTLIEDLLDAARAEDPEIDPHFAEDAEEPLFVKNLENVQGDERDVILFSICYGPDSIGRVSMNFGPMNREGGERRLNVAITRARREVIVFSTLKADQIDLARSRARGVRDLKGFLEYAERGPAVIAEAIQPDPDADFDSPFEEAVFDALVERGWEVHKQVGCARYRIDLAIVDREAPGRYLLGIECDGANYHRAKTARDRDKLREGVLRDLGWKLHRIWSTDWWTDPEREIRKLERALERAREPEDDNAPPEQTAGGLAEPPALKHETFSSAPPIAGLTLAPEPPRFEIEAYRPIADCPPAGSHADFYEGSAVRAIRARLIEVVRQEGPVSLQLAARRVAAAWGFERVRSRAVKQIRRLIPEAEVRIQITDAGEFLWPRELDPANYVGFRVPDANGNGTREADDLPLEEIGNAAVHLLEHHMSAPLDELVRETARLFGFQRVGRVVDERIRKGIEALVERGIARLEGEVIALFQ